MSIHQHSFRVDGATCTETRIPHLAGSTVMLSCVADETGEVAYPDPLQSQSPIAPILDGAGLLVP